MQHASKLATRQDFDRKEGMSLEAEELDRWNNTVIMLFSEGENTVTAVRKTWLDNIKKLRIASAHSICAFHKTRTMEGDYFPKQLY